MRFLSGSFLRTLGMSSYALYITHQPVKFYLEKIRISLNLDYSLGYFLTYLIIAVGLSVVFHQYIEKVMNKKILKKLSS